MYIAKINLQRNKEAIRQYITNHGFATLVCQEQNRLISTHTPLDWHMEGETPCLYGHISIANEMTSAVKNSAEVLVIFMEKHTYISSSWYDHINVPTWNYIAVHINGRFDLLDREQTKASLERLVEKYEKHSADPFSIEKMGDDMYRREVRGITAFRINIDSIEASWKLSQNRDDKNHAEIIRQLRLRDDAMSLMIADEMEKMRNNGRN